MASSYIVIVKDGLIQKAPVRWLPDKRKRKTLLHWKASCASKAIDRGCRVYAARYKGEWHVLHVNHTIPIHPPFPSEDAAAMWILHCGGRYA